jgi:hypothetical protein
MKRRKVWIIEGKTSRMRTWQPVYYMFYFTKREGLADARHEGRQHKYRVTPYYAEMEKMMCWIP